MTSLRFVEVNGDQQNIEILENTPIQMVGHQGQVKPKISNGHISRFHATVCHKFEYGINIWEVSDGNERTGELSRNGLFDKDGDKIAGPITLENVGDRIYLLYMFDTIAYLEVFVTAIDKVRYTSGLESADALDHKIAKLDVNNSILKNQLVNNQEAIHNSEVTKEAIIGKLDVTSQNVEVNKANIESLGKSNAVLTEKLNTMSILLEQGLNHVEEIGSKPRIFIVGFAIMITATMLSVFSYGLYQNINPIMKSIFKIEADINK